MEKQILQVLDFQKAVLAPIPEVPTLVSKERALLRQSLLQEEVTEIATAAEDWYNNPDKTVTEEETLIEILDGIVDCFYILIGTAHEYGLADRIVMAFDEVHRSNMSKFDENGRAIFREDGKVIKGDRYSAPNLSQIIKKDLRAFKDLDYLNELIQKEQQDFINKVDESVYELLDDSDKKDWELFMKLSYDFQKKISVSYDFSDTLNGRKATLTVNGNTVKINENKNLVD
jgi:predicted HAD superfamily Cof-like phosphohydrolase